MTRAARRKNGKMRSGITVDAATPPLNTATCKEAVMSEPQSSTLPEKFRPVSVTLSPCRAGMAPWDVRGYTIGDGVLVATRRQQLVVGEIPDDWCVTHVPTGHLVWSDEREKRSLDYAKRVLLALLAHADGAVWSDGPFTFGEVPPKKWMARGYRVVREVMADMMPRSIGRRRS